MTCVFQTWSNQGASHAPPLNTPLIMSECNSVCLNRSGSGLLDILNLQYAIRFSEALTAQFAEAKLVRTRNGVKKGSPFSMTSVNISLGLYRENFSEPLKPLMYYHLYRDVRRSSCNMMLFAMHCILH